MYIYFVIKAAPLSKDGLIMLEWLNVEWILFFFYFFGVKNVLGTRLIAVVLICCPPPECHASQLIKISLCTVAAPCSFNWVIAGARCFVLRPAFPLLLPFSPLSFSAKHSCLPVAFLLNHAVCKLSPRAKTRVDAFVCTVSAHTSLSTHFTP